MGRLEKSTLRKHKPTAKVGLSKLLKTNEARNNNERPADCRQIRGPRDPEKDG